MTGVIYWQKFKTGKIIRSPVGAACFAGVSHGLVDEIRYLARLSVTIEQFDFWMRFSRKFLTYPKVQYSTKIVSIGRVKNSHVLFRLKMSGNKAKDLLYLTTFRYIEKYPTFVKTMFEKRNSAENPEEMFRDMQQLHIDEASRYAYGGESLFCSHSSYGKSAQSPITMSRFQQNLLDDANLYVQSHFTW